MGNIAHTVEGINKKICVPEIPIFKHMYIGCRCRADCIVPSNHVLESIGTLYSPCDTCQNWNLKKFKPLAEQVDLDTLDVDFGSCICGRRHLDIVMAHVLKIMMEAGVRDSKTTLRNACVPLITPAYPTATVPHLPEDSLVILVDDTPQEVAKKILKEVPEVKGVLKGSISRTVGLKDSDSDPQTYHLLAGCDMRCDVVQTPYGAMTIYKAQGEIHVEFPKPTSPKVSILRKHLDRYPDASVLDCTCGPGTLGIACLKAGASRVVFNDLWYPAARTAALNLEVNGFPVKIPGNLKELEGLSWSSPETPVALGDNFEVYSADLRELKNILDERFDICIIDAFPGVETADLEAAVRDMCSDIVVI